MTVKLHDQMLLTPTAVHMLFESAELTVVSGAIYNVAHSLTVTPKFVHAIIRNKTTELNWPVDSEVVIPLMSSAGGCTIGWTATNVICALNALPSVADKTTGTPAAITAADWKVVLRAYA